MEQYYYDYIFTQCFLKDWKGLSKIEKKVLRDRRKYMDSIFVFSEENIAKLQKINDMLHKKEEAIHAHANLLRKRQKEYVDSNRIDDYEIDFELLLFSSVYDKFHPDFEGNSYYSNESLFHFGDNENDAEEFFVKENWNEFANSSHPLAKDHHCYTFHCIYDHSFLSWQDIMQIEDVWINIVILNQFCLEIK